MNGARGRGARMFQPGLDEGARVGMKIHESATGLGWKTRDGVSWDQKHVRGSIAEVAWWVASGFLWAGDTDYDVERSDCEKTEVRSVFSLSVERGMGAYAYMPLMMRDFELRAKRDKPHIVAAPLRRSLKIFWFHGWYTPREAQQHSEWWNQFQFGPGPDGKGVGAWRVPVSAMHELELLKEME